MAFASFDLGSLTRQALDKHIVLWRPKMNYIRYLGQKKKVNPLHEK